METYAIYGAGGLGREVRAMLELHFGEDAFAGYIDDYKDVLLTDRATVYDNLVIAIADPTVRQVVVDRFRNTKTAFKAVLASDVAVHKSVRIGKGAIVCSGVRMTVNISLGEFVIINLNCTIGHDVVIGDCSSIMPAVNISGNVFIGKNSFVGSGATILQGVNIGDKVIVGAGALVTKDVPSNCVVMGVPARITKMTR